MQTKIARGLDDGVWHVDHTRSSVVFRTRHFGVATVRGRFGSFAGRIVADEGVLRAEGHVEVASLASGNDIRDRRLLAEFFDAEHHPTISLRAAGVEDDRRLLGELTIRGIARPVELKLTTTVQDDGTARARAEGRIRRSDFGLDWDALREAGRLLVADEVRLCADVTLTPEDS
jgi:polyisoprenoid-binding protein YceI